MDLRGIAGQASETTGTSAIFQLVPLFFSFSALRLTKRREGTEAEGICVKPSHIYS